MSRFERLQETIKRQRIDIEELVRRNTELSAELTAMRRQAAELRNNAEQAYRDFLTGLHNRRYFTERLAEEVDRARRYQQVFSLVEVDVNDLKIVNDERGHAAGDQLLRDVGNFLSSNLRNNDICCRLGGDEFVIILPCTDEESAAALVDRLRRVRKRDNTAIPLPFTVAIGHSTYGPHCDSAEGMLRAADESMYCDKRQHKAAAHLEMIPPMSRSSASYGAQHLPS